MLSWYECFRIAWRLHQGNGVTAEEKANAYVQMGMLSQDMPNCEAVKKAFPGGVDTAVSFLKDMYGVWEATFDLEGRPLGEHWRHEPIVMHTLMEAAVSFVTGVQYTIRPKGAEWTDHARFLAPSQNTTRVTFTQPRVEVILPDDNFLTYAY
jgi:hypothetical protein